MPIVKRYYVVFKKCGHHCTADLLVKMTEENEETCLFNAIWELHDRAEIISLCGWTHIGD